MITAADLFSNAFIILSGRSSSKTKFNAFISLNNILNKKYFDNIRINAFGSRYYEPAPGFNIMFGIRK